MISVSMIVLTLGRRAAVEVSLNANVQRAGYEIAELIHVDNGSGHVFTDWFREEFNPSIQVLNRHNLGVAKGYNRGMALASQSHIVITGCDRILPNDWLLEMVKATDAIQNTGAISIYSYPNIADIELRMQPVEMMNGIRIRRSQVCEARMHSRDYLHGVGYLREDFGLYGYEDCEWVDRCERFASAHGLINYSLPDLGYSTHLMNRPELAGGDKYIAMKECESADPRKQALVNFCHAAGNPHYNPYARFEPNMLDFAGNLAGLVER